MLYCMVRYMPYFNAGLCFLKNTRLWQSLINGLDNGLICETKKVENGMVGPDVGQLWLIESQLFKVLGVLRSGQVRPVDLEPGVESNFTIKTYTHTRTEKENLVEKPTDCISVISLKKSFKAWNTLHERFQTRSNQKIKSSQKTGQMKTESW